MNQALPSMHRVSLDVVIVDNSMLFKKTRASLFETECGAAGSRLSEVTPEIYVLTGLEIQCRENT